MITEIPFEIILHVTIRYCPCAKLKSHNSTQFFHHKREDAKTNFFKVIPRGNDFDITLRIKTRHQTLFHQRIRLTKTRCTLLLVLYSHKAIYIPPRRLVSLAADSPDTGEQQKAKWRASAGSTRYRFHHVSPGHATLSAPFTDHRHAIFPPNPPPTCTERIYRANRATLDVDRSIDSTRILCLAHKLS